MSLLKIDQAMQKLQARKLFSNAIELLKSRGLLSESQKILLQEIEEKFNVDDD